MNLQTKYNEDEMLLLTVYGLYVAPYVGAWIETTLWMLLCLLVWSHPLWVRGLKRSHINLTIYPFMSTLRGRVD